MQHIDRPSYMPSYQDDWTVSNYPSLSSENEFVPIIGLNGSKQIINDNRMILLYSLDVQIYYCNALRNFPELTNTITRARSQWGKLNADPRYFANYGSLVYLEGESLNPVPLMMLCIKRRYLSEVINNPLLPTKYLTLLIDNRLTNDITENESGYKIYRNLKKLYIDPQREFVDVYYTNSIVDLCYKSTSLVVPKFRSIQENIDYINSVNTNIVESFSR